MTSLSVGTLNDSPTPPVSPNVYPQITLEGRQAAVERQGEYAKSLNAVPGMAVAAAAERPVSSCTVLPGDNFPILDSSWRDRVALVPETSEYISPLSEGKSFRGPLFKRS